MTFTPEASYRQTVTTGNVTTIAAGTATAGHLLALRAIKPVRLRSLEVEFILTTAFASAQEVGFDAYIARGYTAPHTGATALTLDGGTGKTRNRFDSAKLTGRVADTGALTAGTHTLDGNAIARGSAYFDAVGDVLYPRYFDFTANLFGGLILVENTGLVVRNTVLMGGSGVGKWHFTWEWDEGSVA